MSCVKEMTGQLLPYYLTKLQELVCELSATEFKVTEG